jgi:hypothetical protein
MFRSTILPYTLKTAPRWNLTISPSSEGFSPSRGDFLSLTNWQRWKLPKWQAAGADCQNGRRSKSHAKCSAKLATANIMPKKFGTRFAINILT